MLTVIRAFKLRGCLRTLKCLFFFVRKVLDVKSAESPSQFVTIEPGSCSLRTDPSITSITQEGPSAPPLLQAKTQQVIPLTIFPDNYSAVLKLIAQHASANVDAFSRKHAV